MFVFFQAIFACADTTSNNNIPRPQIKAKVVNNDHVSISWNKCKGATKYEIYRAYADLNDGIYFKIATTKKTSYNDRNAMGNHKIYYKVKAVSKDGRKSSKMSKKKSAFIKCNAKILFPQGNESITLVNDEVYFPVIVEGTSRELTFEVFDENVLVSIENKRGNNYVIKAKYAETQYDRIHHYSIFFKFKGTNMCSEKMTLHILPPTSAEKNKGVPLFSTIVEKATYRDAKAKIRDNNLGYYVYSYNSIKLALCAEYEDDAVNAAINAYIKLLESPTYGFKHIQTDANDDGGNDYILKNDYGTFVAISTLPFFEEEPIVAIVIK